MTTQALEANLPPLMRSPIAIKKLRDEYKAMSISKRMAWTYDYFLRMEVLKHFAERRKTKGTTVIIAPY